MVSGRHPLPAFHRNREADPSRGPARHSLQSAPTRADCPTPDSATAIPKRPPVVPDGDKIFWLTAHPAADRRRK